MIKIVHYKLLYMYLSPTSSMYIYDDDCDCGNVQYDTTIFNHWNEYQMWFCNIEEYISYEYNISMTMKSELQ